LQDAAQFYLLLTNHRVRLTFSVDAVLLASGGDQVSFYPTVGGDVLLKDKL